MNAVEPSGDACYDGAFRRTSLELARKPPNTEWLLAMLSTMEPGHAIFAKDYVKPRSHQNSEAAGEYDTDMVENVDGWFDGLPVAKSRKGAPIKLAASSNSAAAEAHKLRKLQEKAAAIQAKINQQQHRVRSNSQDQHAQPIRRAAVVGDAVDFGCGASEKAAAAFADEQVFEQADQLPVAGMGPNVIGNVSDDDAASSMAGLSVSMADNTSTNRNREQGRVPKSLVKTRRERKNDTLMAEAG